MVTTLHGSKCITLTLFFAGLKDNMLILLGVAALSYVTFLALFHLRARTWKSLTPEDMAKMQAEQRKRAVKEALDSSSIRTTT